MIQNIEPDWKDAGIVCWKDAQFHAVAGCASKDITDSVYVVSPPTGENIAAVVPIVTTVGPVFMMVKSTCTALGFRETTYPARSQPLGWNAQSLTR